MLTDGRTIWMVAWNRVRNENVDYWAPGAFSHGPFGETIIAEIVKNVPDELEPVVTMFEVPTLEIDRWVFVGTDDTSKQLLSTWLREHPAELKQHLDLILENVALGEQTKS